MNILLEASILPRPGPVAGFFPLWSVAFIALARSAPTPVENLVLVPVVVSAMLPGVRGTLAGSSIGVLGICTCRVIAGTGPFTRLIPNDLKYSSEDRPVEATVDSEPGQLRISVIDHGPGISKTDRDKLFAPIFCSTNPEALLRTGTGSGLVLAKSIVEEHGGNSSVSGRLGGGSTFTVVLPLATKVGEARSA